MRSVQAEAQLIIFMWIGPSWSSNSFYFCFVGVFFKVVWSFPSSSLCFSHLCGDLLYFVWFGVTVLFKLRLSSLVVSVWFRHASLLDDAIESRLFKDVPKASPVFSRLQIQYQ